MSDFSPAPTPKTLDADGRVMWQSIASKYELRPDELHRLEAACRTADMIAKLEERWAEMGYPMVTSGSMGQEVIHPIIGELRAQRAALNTKLIALKLPDLDAGAETNQNREAATASWQPGAARSGRGA